MIKRKNEYLKSQCIQYENGPCIEKENEYFSLSPLTQALSNFLTKKKMCERTSENDQNKLNFSKHYFLDEIRWAIQKTQ